MADETMRTCVECEGAMSPIVVMDYYSPKGQTMGLQYRQPDDKRSFWTGGYPSAGTVQAYMCQGCGRIALYGNPTKAANDESQPVQ